MLGEVLESVISDDTESTILENFTELPGQLHDLGANLADLCKVVFHTLNVFLINLLALSLFLHNLDRCLLQSSCQVKGLFNDGSKALDLLIRQEISILLIGAVECFESLSQVLKVSLSDFFVEFSEALGVDLLNVNWESLLEQSDVLLFTDCYQDVIE